MAQGWWLQERGQTDKFVTNVHWVNLVAHPHLICTSTQSLQGLPDLRGPDAAHRLLLQQRIACEQKSFIATNPFQETQTVAVPAAFLWHRRWLLCFV